MSSNDRINYRDRGGVADRIEDLCRQMRDLMDLEYRFHNNTYLTDSLLSDLEVQLQNSMSTLLFNHIVSEMAKQTPPPPLVSAKDIDDYVRQWQRRIEEDL